MSRQTITRTATSAPVATVEDAKRRLYDAETALHAAHSSHIDQWIAAAADRLHEAVEAYLAAIATAE